VTTQRTFTAATAGATLADVTSPIGEVNVIVDPSLSRADITVTTTDTEGPVADAVRRATIRESARGIEVSVPDIPGGTQSVTFSGRGMRVMQNVVSNGGGMTGVTISGGDVYVGGRRIVSDGRVVAQAGTAVMGTGTVTVEVRLPRGSALRLTTTSADLTVRGALAQLAAHSVSGDITAQAVHALSVNTTSGDTEVELLHEQADITSVSGDIDISAYRGSDLRMQAVSGDIRITATPDAAGVLSANTVSGDITTRGTARLDVRTSTISGRVRR
jgi:hypothetical protein